MVSAVCVAALLWLLPQGPASASNAPTLRLAPERPTYVLGEPIRLTLVVQNEGPTTVKGRFELFDFNERMSMYFRPRGGQFREVPRRMDREADYVIHVKTIEPGAEAQFEKTILLDESTKELLLGTVGDYEFYVSGRPFSERPDAVVTSGIASVTIEEPPAGQRDAMERYLAAGLYRFVGGAISPSDRAASADALVFLERYPSAPYAAAVGAALFHVIESRVLYGATDDEDRALYERLRKELAASREGPDGARRPH